MKRVILGCGYVGKALLDYWQSDKATLVATTTNLERQKELQSLANEVAVLHGDDETALKKVFSDAKEVVICVAPKNGQSYEKTYLATAKAISIILNQETTVEHLIYTSSTSVYGNYHGQWVTEESELRPIGRDEKILCDTEALYLNALPQSVLVTVLRLGGTYGPQREHEKRARQMAGTIRAGSGEHFTNWIHQQDVVRVIDWVLKNRLSGLYNVCNDEHPTRKQLYEAILSKLNLPFIQWDPSQEAPHLGNKRVSNEKIKQTGFQFCMRGTDDT
ncbi:MAG: SDR family oxidoreductase [Parachlamydiaceae bacterium]